eukprot:g61769.t1
MLSLVACLSLSAKAYVLGTNPDDAALYAGPTFTCAPVKSEKYLRPALTSQGLIHIPISQVNDDYCDCPDGTDEPGTGACSPLGHLPETLLASRVGDGICDCCDGSDEANSGAACPDTCDTLNAMWRAEREELLVQVRGGLAKKATMLQEAKTKTEARKKELAEVEVKLAELNSKLQQLQTQKEEEEKKEKEEADIHKETAIRNWAAALELSKFPEEELVSRLIDLALVLEENGVDQLMDMLVATFPGLEIDDIETLHIAQEIKKDAEYERPEAMEARNKLQEAESQLELLEVGTGKSMPPRQKKRTKPIVGRTYYGPVGSMSQGGIQYRDECTDGTLASAIFIRAGALVDSVKLECSRVTDMNMVTQTFPWRGGNGGDPGIVYSSLGEKKPFRDLELTYSSSALSSIETYGGSQGTTQLLQCAEGQYISGITGRAGKLVDSFGILCRAADVPGLAEVIKEAEESFPYPEQYQFKGKEGEKKEEENFPYPAEYQYKKEEGGAAKEGEAQGEATPKNDSPELVAQRIVVEQLKAEVARQVDLELADIERIMNERKTELSIHTHLPRLINEKRQEVEKLVVDFALKANLTKELATENAPPIDLTYFRQQAEEVRAALTTAENEKRSAETRQSNLKKSEAVTYVYTFIGHLHEMWS